jgi:hypothetical protein
MAIDNISFEDFHAFIRIRDGGKFNMMTQCAEAAVAERISVDKHIAIMMNFDTLMSKYGVKLEKPAPTAKPKHKKGAVSFEPDETSNGGYVQHAFVVQSRIPAIEKYKNWKIRSGELNSLAAAVRFIEDQKRIRSYSNGPKHKYRIVEKTVFAAVVYED